MKKEKKFDDEVEQRRDYIKDFCGTSLGLYSYEYEITKDFKIKPHRKIKNMVLNGYFTIGNVLGRLYFPDGIEFSSDCYSEDGTNIAFDDFIVIEGTKGKYGLIDNKMDVCLDPIYESINKVLNTNNIYCVAEKVKGDIRLKLTDKYGKIEMSAYFNKQYPISISNRISKCDNIDVKLDYTIDCTNVYKDPEFNFTIMEKDGCCYIVNPNRDSVVEIYDRDSVCIIPGTEIAYICNDGYYDLLDIYMNIITDKAYKNIYLSHAHLLLGESYLDKMNSIEPYSEFVYDDDVYCVYDEIKQCVLFETPHEIVLGVDNGYILHKISEYRYHNPGKIHDFNDPLVKEKFEFMNLVYVDASGNELDAGVDDLANDINVAYSLYKLGPTGDLNIRYEIISVRGRYGYLDRHRNSVVIQPIYDSLGEIHYSTCLVCFSKKYGVCSLIDGRVIIPIKYSTCTYENDKYYMQDGDLLYEYSPTGVLLDTHKMPYIFVHDKALDDNYIKDDNVKGNEKDDTIDNTDKYETTASNYLLLNEMELYGTANETSSTGSIMNELLDTDKTIYLSTKIKTKVSYDSIKKECVLYIWELINNCDKNVKYRFDENHNLVDICINNFDSRFTGVIKDVTKDENFSSYNLDATGDVYVLSLFL